MSSMLFLPDRDHPFLHLQLHFVGGSASDPPGKEGLAYLTGQLLQRGAAGLSRRCFAEAVEGLGGALSVSVGRESLVVEADTLLRNRDAVLDRLADSVVRPDLLEEELDRLRRQTVAELEDLRDSDEDLAQHLFFQALYQPDPSARPVKGTEASLERIGPDDIRACYARIFTRANLFAAGCGDADGEELGATLERRLSDLPAGVPPPRPVVVTEDPGRIRVILVDKPERTQTQLFAGRSSVSASHPDFDALTVANTVFGGTFTARLSHEIREKRGWSYGAYSTLYALRSHGALVMRYYPARADTVAALELGLAMMRDWVADGVTEDEAAFARGYLHNHFPFRFESARKRLEQAVHLRLLGLPADHLDGYLDRIGAVTSDVANAALARHVRADDLTVVMVCSADGLQDAVRAVPGVGSVEVHPYDHDWPHP